MSTVTVYALDGLTQIAQLTAWEHLEVTQNDLDVGVWSITVPLGGVDSVPNRWLAAPNAGIEIVDPDTGWRFAGPVVRAERTIRPAGGASTVRVTGVDFQVELARRLSVPTPLNLSNWWTVQEPDRFPATTLPLTSACYSMVRYNAHGPDTPVSGRAIPNLVFGLDPGAGPSKTFMPVGDTLLDELRSWLEGTGYGARLRLDRPATGDPVMLFECGARPWTTFVLTDANVGEYTVTDTAATATRVFALGGTDQVAVDAERAARGLADTDPDPPVRYFTEGGAVGAGSTWQNPHVEKFINRPSTTFEWPSGVGSLSDEVNDEVRLGGPGRSITVPDFDVDSFGRYFEVGWLVPTSFLFEQSAAASADYELLPIVSYRFTSDGEDGERRTVTLGARSGRPEEAIFRSLDAAQRAVKKLETMLGRNL